MARTYKVTIDKNTPDSGGYQQGAQADEIQTLFNVNYKVLVDDDAPGFDGSQVDVFEILSIVTPAQSTTSIALPIVNATAYYNPETGLLNPYLICRSKVASRDAGNKRLWRVQTGWDTGKNAATTEGDNSGVTPPNQITDLAPRFEFRLGNDPDQKWIDEDGNEMLTPTRNEFPEPFFRDIATQIITIHHYVSFISYDTMQFRRFKVNELAWSGGSPHQWIIRDVEATEVWVQLAAGPFLAALVSYTVEKTSRPEGWVEKRNLVDTHYYEIADDPATKTAFTDETTRTLIANTVQENGTPWNNVPLERTHRVQPHIDFNTFLPEPSP